MPIDVLTGFVDRRHELARFRQMLRGDTDERILLIVERGEQGKTYFLLRLLYECEDASPPVPVVRLDFDQARSGLFDYLTVAREVRRYLGDERTPAICACEGAPGGARRAYRGSLHALLVAHFSQEELRTICFVLGGDYDLLAGEEKEGKARELILHLEREGRVLELAAEARRQRPHVPWPDVPRQPRSPAAGLAAPSEAEVGRALCSDLARLADVHSRAVLLIDTFEQAGEGTCAWLERWLFEPLRRDDLAHVLLVVAGRHECRAFFSRPHLWGRLVATIDRFEPLSDEDVWAHYRQRGLDVSETEVSLLRIARSSPARMAQVGDLLAQARGGAR